MSDPGQIPLLPAALAVLAAYGLGCVNTGYYLVRWTTGRDVRTLGSGNAGARNVGRVLGPWGFAAALLGDALKGALAVWGAQVSGLPPPLPALSLLAVTAGHNWPAQLGFRGGKGMAASFSALLFLDPPVAGCALAVVIVLLAVLRRFTVPAMVAYALNPVAALLLGRDYATAAILAALAVLVVAAHRDNLRAERRADGSPSPDSP